ncbi:MAG TPA: LacI family DNA-binding transcriptional regulator [Capsulimonadaceae bacterium]|jgi:LacI family transcriptional regulator
MAATIFDIAKACGTSKTTVSKVLTGNDERISDAKRIMIHEAMERLNYRPNSVARALCTKRSNAIGFVTSRVSHMVSRPYYAALLDAVLDEATVAGQRLTMYNTHGANSAEMDPLTFSDGHCGGLIVLGVPDAATRIAIKMSNLPCIVVNGGHPEEATVSIQVDNKQAGYDATKYLVDLGHTRIAYVHMNGIALSNERLEGYRLAMRDAGLPVPDDLVFAVDYDPTAAYSTAGAIANSPGLGITALFCVTDEYALSAIQGFRDAGRRVPDEFSVIGIDGVIEGERCFPRLTTLSQSLHELGKEAVKRLLASFESTATEPLHVVWPTKLIERGSTSAQRPI